MTLGWVVFRLDKRVFASPLDEVREVVRLDRIEPLPGANPPMAGIIVLRGAPLPVVDVRAEPGRAGDVLVLDSAGDVVAVAVDKVLAVRSPAELPEIELPSRHLPPFVVGARRQGDATVLVVDLHKLVDLATNGLLGALEGSLG